MFVNGDNNIYIIFFKERNMGNKIFNLIVRKRGVICKNYTVFFAS